MAEQREFEGKDLDSALDEAASALRIPADELHYEIVEQGRRGVFGLGAKSVRIRVQPPLDELTDSAILAAPEPPVRPGAVEVPRPAANTPGRLREVEDTVQRILDLMRLELSAQVEAVDGGLTIEMKGADRRLIEQKDGELLFALQFVLNRMSRRIWPEAGRIHLTVDGDRQRRDEELIGLAREVAQQVARTGRAKLLHPMNAYERRLVHVTVREFSGVSSRSEGVGAMKRIRIGKDATPGD